MVIPARVGWRGPFSKTSGVRALHVSGEAHSTPSLVVSQQPVQRRAPFIGERETPVRTGDKTFFKQGGDAPGVGPFGVRLDVEKHRAFCGREAVRRYGLRTRL